MNVQLSNLISDIVGETGLRITEAIIAGQRDPMQLAALCSTRIKASRETVAKSLHGNWEEAMLFALKAALETYRFIQTKILLDWSIECSVIDKITSNRASTNKSYKFQLQRVKWLRKRSQITQPSTRSRLATSTTSSWREMNQAVPLLNFMGRSEEATRVESRANAIRAKSA